MESCVEHDTEPHYPALYGSVGFWSSGCQGIAEELGPTSMASSN